MQQAGEFQIPAARERVWAALNDPSVLQQCIEGCEEMQRVDDTHFVAKVRAKVGPVSATFAGEVELTDLDPPNSYTLVGSGKGGAAGFAKGEAKVRLDEAGAGATVLRYEVHANVGGKLAQIGSRLVDGAARKMADDFFSRFVDVLAASTEPAADTTAIDDADAARAPAPATPPAPEQPRTYEPSGQRVVWFVVFGITIAALLLAAL